MRLLPQHGVEPGRGLAAGNRPEGERRLHGHVAPVAQRQHQRRRHVRVAAGRQPAERVQPRSAVAEQCLFAEPGDRFVGHRLRGPRIGGGNRGGGQADYDQQQDQ